MSQERRVLQGVGAGLQDIDKLLPEPKEVVIFKNGMQPHIESTFEAAYKNPPTNPVHDKADWSGLSEEALEWISTRSLELAKMVNNTTKEELRILLAQGFESGDSIAQIKASISTYYEGCKKGRALMVARTETVAASNEGALQRYEADGLDEVEWLTAKDDRLCEECEPYDGEVFSTAESHGMMPAHPNCRCVWLPVIKTQE